MLHSLVRDAPAALAGRAAAVPAAAEGREGEEAAGGVDRDLLTEAFRAAAPALAKLQVGNLSLSFPCPGLVTKCTVGIGTGLFVCSRRSASQFSLWVKITAYEAGGVPSKTP